MRWARKWPVSEIACDWWRKQRLSDWLYVILTNFRAYFISRNWRCLKFGENIPFISRFFSTSRKLRKLIPTNKVFVKAWAKRLYTSEWLLIENWRYWDSCMVYIPVYFAADCARQSVSAVHAASESGLTTRWRSGMDTEAGHLVELSGYYRRWNYEAWLDLLQRPPVSKDETSSILILKLVNNS